MTTKRTDARLGEILIGNAGLQSYISPDECEKPGAWRELHLGEHGGAGLIVWRMEDDDRSPEQEAAAERLVACWNACQGLPTEALLAPEPAWEPLTPERMEKLLAEKARGYYWLRIRDVPSPWVGCIRSGGGVPVFSVVGHGHVQADFVTHILPVSLPEMPR